MSSLTFAFLMCAVLLLSGCVSFYPTDLQENRLQLIEYRSIPEYEKNVEKLVASGKEWKLSEKKLRVEFTSNVNLYVYSREHSYPVSAVQKFCDTPDFLVIQDPYVYYQGERVEFASKLVGQKAPYRYYAYLSLSQPQTGSYTRFDLTTTPADICVTFAGGAGGFGFQSNVVRIRAEQYAQ